MDLQDVTAKTALAAEYAVEAAELLSGKDVSVTAADVVAFHDACEALDNAAKYLVTASTTFMLQQVATGGIELVAKAAA